MHYVEVHFCVSARGGGELVAVMRVVVDGRSCECAVLIAVRLAAIAQDSALVASDLRERADEL